jgi:hypothetical protein
MGWNVTGKESEGKGFEQDETTAIFGHDSYEQDVLQHL